ncbi:hypothetical protein HMPREF9074_08571 [Capnocytophaga sp. oral taxon 329 str. F0087]|nr:hypothetical protein HMPREF9074_08571 [Capnocytophaga sp. oral taxon 329 str. F0087]
MVCLLKKGCSRLQTTLILLLFFAKSLAYSTFAPFESQKE